MVAEQIDQSRLPLWLQEPLEDGEPTDGFPNKRREPRLAWVAPYTVREDKEPTATKITVRGLNVCSSGLGCISRVELPVRQVFELAPVSGDGDDESVRVRVIHCTETVGGYKIGFELIPANPGAGTDKS